MKSASFLVVDHNPVALGELANILKYIGKHEIHAAEGATEAYSLLKVKPVDCLISAWEMPDMSGLALLKIIRKDDRFYNLPVFLTHHAFTKLKVIEAGQSGVSGLFVVPYNLDTIKAKLESLAVVAVDEEIAAQEELFQQGLELVEKNEYDQALSLFEKLIQEGESAEYYYNIGYIKTAKGEYEEALRAFRKATQIDRLFAKAYEAMGRVYKTIGKPHEAQKYLQKAADIYMSKEKDQNAEEILNEILNIGSGSVNVYNSLGVLYRKKGDYQTALTNYQKALKVHPNEAYIHYNIGRLYLDMKDPRKAKSCFARALKINPGFQQAREVINAIELGSI